MIGAFFALISLRALSSGFPSYFLMSSSNPMVRPGQSLEGMVFRPANQQELSHGVKMAFDYRGDVTIKLSSGLQITGYVFDWNEREGNPYLRLFLRDVIEPRQVSYADIREIAFSGEDTAFGRSWEDWVKKWSKDSSGKPE